MVKFNLEEKLNKAFETAGIEGNKREEYWNTIKSDLDEPVRLIGAGQTGVGKTTLLRSIFAIEKGDIPEEMTTNTIDPETDTFQSFQIENEDGFAIEFTDGPGLGEDIRKDEEYIPQWIDEIPNHDLLYWVVDASSRDVSHIQRNMKRILDETGYADRIVVVLNKVDQIPLKREDRKAGKKGWDEEYNLPTPELEEQINRRINHLVKKFSHVGISEEQIVACSALKRWNTMEVFQTLVEHLSEEKQIKVSANRDVDHFTELMSQEALAEIQDDVGDEKVETVQKGADKLGK